MRVYFWRIVQHLSGDRLHQSPPASKLQLVADMPSLRWVPLANAVPARAEERAQAQLKPKTRAPRLAHIAHRCERRVAERSRPLALGHMMAIEPGTDICLNARAAALVDSMLADAAALGIGVTTSPDGALLVDCGGKHPGSIAAGLRLAGICMAGLADISLVPAPPRIPLPWSVMVRTSQPVLACLASQYAGWHFDAGNEAAALLASGPARALARREPLFDAISHLERCDRAVLVLESASSPPAAVLADIAQACALTSQQLTILYAATNSLAGMTQIAGRVLECAVQKAHLLAFPLERLIDAVAAAPLCAPHPDAVAAMGRANDAIIYAGVAHLFVTGSVDDARHLAAQLPSATASAWGRPFADIYREAGGDFSAIDSGLFSPAEIRITALESGETFSAGRVDAARLQTGSTSIDCA